MIMALSTIGDNWYLLLMKAFSGDMDEIVVGNLAAESKQSNSQKPIYFIYICREYFEDRK